MRISPKLHFLANVAARYRGQSLSNFIEDAIKDALTPEAMLGDEPQPGHTPIQKQEPFLWNEGLWSDDEATRVYLLMLSHPDCASPSQQRTWAKISRQAAKDGKKLTLRVFT